MNRVIYKSLINLLCRFLKWGDRKVDESMFGQSIKILNVSLCSSIGQHPLRTSLMPNNSNNTKIEQGYISHQE